MTPLASERGKRFTGLPVSGGVALAPVYPLDRGGDTVPYYCILAAGIETEKRRLQNALRVTSERLEDLIRRVNDRIGPSQANIFVAQQMMVEDPALAVEMMAVIEEKRLNAETAVSRVLDAYESKLTEVDDEYIKERASDIGEIRRRVIEILHGGAEEGAEAERVVFDEPHIVVAEELTPSETVTLDTAHTAGFITERGGAASHAAILARALGIPAVSGIKDVLGKFNAGEEVLLNGATGEVILRPSQTAVNLYPSARRAAAPRIQSVEPVPGLAVLGNISLASNVELLHAVRAEGVGLYRTEFEFLAAGRVLTEDEQYERYVAVVQAMAGKPVYARLLDFGGDKTATFLHLPAEDNPCLGYRGARFLQGEPQFLVAQARALARASAQGPIHVCYPMIIDLDQFLKLRAIVLQSVRDIAGAQLQHGVMLEVPSACLQARQILDVADFASIGSNDLVQYLFAVDRNNELVAENYAPDHPILWSLPEQMVEAARDAQKPLSLCGELGAEPRHLPRLLQTGIQCVSVSPRLIGLARMAAKRALGL